MGQSRWRSLAPPLLVASALVALGACTPQFDLNNSPPPCIKGYSPCPMTGICQPDDPDAVPVNLDTTGAAPSLVKLPLNCPSMLTVRQSSSVFLPTPGVRLEDITVATLPGERLVATPTTDGSGAVGVSLVAPPGTPPGDQLVPLYKQRFLTINTKVGDYAFPRTIFIVVSTINAGGPDGNDSNAGLFASPFATFRHAADVAQPGDTIDLRNVSDTDAAPVTVRSGVTVRSVAIAPVGTDGMRMGAQVILPMEIDLAGDADLEGINLSGSRLVIDVPGSHVILKNVTNDHGLTVSSKASVPPGAVGTNVEIISASTLTNRLATLQSPLLVQADGAVVALDSQSMVQANDPGGMVDTIRFEGSSQTLTIGGGVNVTNLAGGNLMHLVGSVNLTVSGDDVRLINHPVLIDDPASNADFHGTVFDAAPLTFKGSSLSLLDNASFSDSLVTFQGQMLTVADTTFSLQGITQSAPTTPNIASSAQFETATFNDAPVTFSQGDLSIQMGTKFTNSPLTFHGRALSVANTIFDGDGIVQDAVDSTSTLSQVTIKNYSQFGYHLLMGKAAISESFFTHDPMVTPSLDGKTPPWALWVEAAGDSDSSVSSQGTLYDTKPFAPTPCNVYGPCALGGLYSISDHIEISFCN